MSGDAVCASSHVMEICEYVKYEARMMTPNSAKPAAFIFVMFFGQFPDALG
jgi:hypothetical protein